MYQAYVFQKCGDYKCRIMLGRNFETKDDAEEMVRLYAEHFGKVDGKVIEEAGTPLPELTPKKKKTLKELLWSLI